MLDAKQGFLLTSLIWLALSGSPFLAASASEDRPNIIFLLADDQATISVGCYGNPDVQTPHIDQLAKDGMLFEKHYNTTAICMGSRASIMTGMYEYKTGCNFGKGNLQAGKWNQSYPVLLRKSGYLSAFAGKFGFKVTGKGICEADFDVYGGSPGQSSYETAENKSMADYADRYPHSTRAYGAFGQDFIKQAVKENKPFCLSISFKAPHRPATPDPEFNSVYSGKTFTRPGNFDRDYAIHLSEQSKQGRQYPRFIEWNYDTDYDGVMAKYHQLVFGIDKSVGMIREELERPGVKRFPTLDFDAATADTWARLLARLKQKGQAMPIKDSLIAAVAKKHGIVAATCNVIEFKKAGVKLINPFDG